MPGATACEWFREAYRDRPFVRLLPAPPELTHAVGTNYALIHAVRARPADKGGLAPADTELELRRRHGSSVVLALGA